MPAVRDHWFKANPIDWLEGLETCNDEAQVAVYCVVILRIYSSGGPIPNNPEAIGVHARMSRTRTARTIAALLASGKLYLVGDRLMNGRAATELEQRAELSAVRSAAGKTAKKPTKNQPTSDQLSGKKEAKLVESESVSASGMAENSHSAEANAPTRAREKKREEKNPPIVPQEDDGSSSFMWPRRRKVEVQPMPADYDPDLSQGMAKVSALSQRPGVDPDFSARVTAEVMRLANMVRPPNDMVLVTTWLQMGMDPEEDIFPHVLRLAGSSRGPVRGINYFDKEVRAQFAAKKAASESNIADFRRIRRRHQRPPSEFAQG